MLDKWGAKLKQVMFSTTEAFISLFQVNTAIAAKQCQSVRLFSQDETRYGVFPVVSRRITLPGIKPIAEIDYRYESVYLYGAVEPLTGERFFFELSHLNKSFWISFQPLLNLWCWIVFTMPSPWRSPRTSSAFFTPCYD